MSPIVRCLEIKFSFLLPNERIPDDGTDPTVTSTSIISVTLTDLYGTEVALTGEVELCFSSSLANIEVRSQEVQRK